MCGDGQRPGAPRAVAAQLHKRHVLRSRRTVRTHRAPAAPPAPASAPQDHAAGPAKDVRVGFRNASKKGGAAGAHGAGKREAAPADGAKRDAKSPVVVRRHVVVHETPGPVRERVCTRGGGAGLHRPPQQRGIAAIDSDDESGDAAGGAVIVPETCQKPRRSGLGAGGAVVVGCTPPSGGERDSRGVASGREKSSAGRFAVRKQLVFSPVGKRRQRSSSGHGVCEGVAESVSDSFEEVGAPSAPLGVGSIGAGDSLLPLGAGDMPRSAVKSPSPSPSPWRSPAGGEEHGAGGGSEGEAVERGEQAGKGAATWTEKEEEASEELIVVLSEESGRSGENGRARGEEASSREKGVEEVKETERPARKGKGTESGGGRAGGKGKGRGAGKALGVRKGAAASKQGKGGSNTRGRAALGKIEGASAAPGTSVGGGRWSLRASTVLDGKATRSAAIAEGRLKQGQEGVAAGVAQEGGRRDEKRGAGGGERGVKRGREGDDRRGQLEGGKVDLAKDGAERKREGERAPGAAARKKRAAHGDMPVAESGNADVVQPRAKRASTAMSTMATMALARQAASVCEPAGGRERQGKVAQGQGRKVLGRTAQAKARRQGVVNGKVDL